MPEDQSGQQLIWQVTTHNTVTQHHVETHQIIIIKCMLNGK